MSALEYIITTLRQRRRELSAPYYVPGLWTDCACTEVQQVNPYDFYAEKLESILASDPIPVVQGESNGGWTRYAIVYNLFPRVTAAFDHTQDGVLWTVPSSDGWRDTGTLLKCIALLPYIQRMNINTVHLLPITSVGQDGKKGTLGSPYAIRNAYKLDENLAEPALCLDVDELFAGFVEAAHRMGIRVVMEFVLRTASRDADWIGEHPEWFYWIREDVSDRQPDSMDSHAFGSPVFPPDLLRRAKDMVHRRDFSALPAPPETYRAMYTRPPRPEEVYFENGRWVGVLQNGMRVRIPGAFSDWPPDDPQPPWTDVTYLRLYEHHEFNYMAYNTLRMYDDRLAQPSQAVHGLWDAITGVIPHYQQKFGIDGVLIDMGHALPMPLKQRIVETARSINPDFAFWDENFLIEQKSVDEGYNAVVGYVLFDFPAADRLRGFLSRLAYERMPIPYFATAENHNTPRAFSRPFGLEFVHYVLAMSVLMPGVPFVHSGFELMETKPINTGLGFSSDMIRQHPSDSLPLFSEWAFDWTRPHNLVGSVRYAFEIRKKYAELLSNPDPATFFLGYSNNPQLIVVARQDQKCTVVLIGNSSMGTTEMGKAYLPVGSYQLAPMWGTGAFHRGAETVALEIQLDKGQVLILEGDESFPRLQK
jgi:glycosidase